MSSQLLRVLRQPLQQGIVSKTYVRPLSITRIIPNKKDDNKAPKTPQSATEKTSTTIPQDQTTFDKYIEAYRCPEYYSHSDTSYYDIENEMSSSRLEQPSAL